VSFSTSSSSIIEDLSVCGKADRAYAASDIGSNSFIEQAEPAFASTPKKPLQDSNTIHTYNQVEHVPAAATTAFEDQLHNLGLRATKEEAAPTGVVSKKGNPNHNQNAPNKSSAFVKTDKGRVESRVNPYYANFQQCGGRMENAPLPKFNSTQISERQTPPNLSDARVVYTASELEQKYFEQASKMTASKERSAIFQSIVAKLTGGSGETPITEDFPPLQKTPVPPKNKHPASQDQNLDPKKKMAFNITPDSPLYKLVANQPQKLKTPQGKAQRGSSTNKAMRSPAQSPHLSKLSNFKFIF